MPRKKRDHEAEWEETIESGYEWPRPKRISVYIFDAQLRMLRQIAKEKGLRLRHVFFEAFQFYIGVYLQNKREAEHGRKK
jgi:hypothetical protein